MWKEYSFVCEEVAQGEGFLLVFSRLLLNQEFDRDQRSLFGTIRDLVYSVAVLSLVVLHHGLRVFGFYCYGAVCFCALVLQWVVDLASILAGHFGTKFMTCIVLHMGLKFLV